MASLPRVKRSTIQTYRQRLLVVLVHIGEHLEDDLSLEELSGISHFSPFHFHRIFRAMVGESVSHYVRRLRLESAAVRLTQTKKPILELAMASGYSSHESFTRAFKDAFGISPSEFRKNERPPAPGPSLRLGAETGAAEEGLDMRVQIVSLPPQKIAFIRHTGPYDQVGPAFDKLMMWAGPHGLIVPGLKVLGVCYDDPNITAAEKIRYDAAITVDDDVDAEGEVGVRELAGGPYAVVCHQGPYNELGTTYDFMYGRWLSSMGYEPADAPPFEHYLNGPESTEPEELLTDVHVPLRM